MTTIGIVGPRDVVTSTTDVCAQLPGVDPRSLPYGHETDTPEVMADAPADVDAWLFTGVVPYEIAASHDLLDRPAAYVEYTGATLLGVVVQLLRDGRDVTSMSIDVLAEAQVRETFEEVGLPMDGVRVLPYRLGLGADEVTRFHREKAKRDGTTVAVTCLRSAYDELRADLVAVRMAPSVHSVRTAVNQLLLTYGSQRSDDAQIALGLVEAGPGAEAALRREVGALGGSLLRYDDKRFLIITTRGPLEHATASFTELAMLPRVKAENGPVRVGFGIGGSGAEAEALARRALGRAGSIGRTAAVVSLRNDIDVTLSASAPPRPSQRSQLNLLAQRAGLSKATLQRLQELVQANPDEGVTTRVLAEHLGVQPRTARRVLNRLERAGVARAVGTQTFGGSGRPLVIYRVYL